MLAIFEHWLKEEDLATIHLEGYKLANYFARTQHKGGGVALFHKESMEVSSKVNFCTFKPVEKEFEYTIAEYVTKDSKYVFISVYRSPSGNVDTFINLLSELLHEIYKPLDCFIIGGDFNCNFKDTNDNNALILTNLFNSYGIKPHIFGPTRPVSGRQPDSIFSNINETNVLQAAIYATNISDHYGQVLDFKVNEIQNKPTYTKKRFFTNANMLRFNNYLQNESWEGVYTSQGVEEKYATFFRIMFYYFDLSFPLSKSRLKSRSSSWVTAEIRNYSNYIKDLYVWYKHTNNEQNFRIYKREKKTLTNLFQIIVEH